MARTNRSFTSREELDEKLCIMAKTDERSVSSFLRWLISEEWERRNVEPLIHTLEIVNHSEAATP